MTGTFEAIKHRDTIEIQFGDEWCKGHITKVDDYDQSIRVFVDEMREEWMFPNQEYDAVRLRIPEEPTRANGSVTTRLRRQVTETSADLEAVTKERDDAREQLARVCAQVETLARENRALHEYKRMADDDAERHEALLGKRSKDTRILDCVATLLAMRETL